MFKLPEKTVLGELNIQSILEYFDFPRIFVCRNTTNQLYLVLSTYDDEQVCHWLYIAISPLRLKTVLSGAIPLKNAFINPEGGYLYVVKSYADQGVELTHIFPEQLDDADLPNEKYCLNVDADEFEEEILDPQQVAKASRRETFNYHIYPGNKTKHEIAARKLGGILTATQELIDALGQAVDGEPTVRGPLPVELLHKTMVNVTRVFQGSFGVQFRSAQHADLLDNSKVSDAIAELGNLILAADSEDLLSNKLHSLKGRVASKYRRLLKELDDIGSGILVDWGAVSDERGGKFTLSRAQIRNAYNIVDRIDIGMAEEISIRGRLVGYNSRTHRYEIASSEDSKNYAGKVAIDARIEVDHPAIGDYYFARLRMLIETQSTSGDELIRWVLVGLSKDSTE